MPWAAAFTSSMLIPTRTFSQKSTGEWTPNAITWSSIAPTPCRIVPATEREIESIWGEALKVDAIAWLAPSVVLPPQVLTSDSGEQTPVQVDGVTYMVVKVRDLAHMVKLKAVALRRFTHG